MAGKGVMGVLKTVYDKLIALVVLIILIASLLYLAVRVGSISGEQARFRKRLEGAKPKFELAERVDTAPYERALQSLEQPYRATPEQRAVRFVIPETRVWCVECRRPIPVTIAEEGGACSFCGATQPKADAVDPERDSDGDGIKDTDEVRFRMNPFDPADAARDMDGDGFTNLEELQANPPSDPTDPASLPPIVSKLRVKEIRPDPFKLRFKGANKMPDGSLKFQLNLRGGGRTFFARLGEEVEGFKVLEFKPKLEKQDSATGPRNVDVSVLTLKRGEKIINLVKDQEVQHDEYTAALLLTVDGTEYPGLRIDTEFDVRGAKYRVIGIDSGGNRVVIADALTGARTEVDGLPAGGVPAVEPAAP